VFHHLFCQKHKVLREKLLVNDQSSAADEALPEPPGENPRFCTKTAHFLATETVFKQKRHQKKFQSI